MRRLFFLILFLYATSAFAHFSNMIVFGDSLSDGGNFPESSQVWWHPAAAKTLENTVPQLYVPFANPVNTDSKSTTWPILDNRYLAKQTNIENNSAERKFHSISWPQFFLGSKIISPSHLLNSRTIPASFSFNYAWGYATSRKHCVNPRYQSIACDAKSIYLARRNYEKNPSKENYLKLEIPGLFQQVQLFFQDYHAHKVSVDNNTVYVFWIGGNDLIIASNALRKHGNPFPAFGFILGNTAKHVIQNVSQLIQGLPKNQRPQKIYIFDLFNPGLTPGYYHTPLASIADFFVQCSNFWLTWDARLFNLFSDTKMVIVPTYQWYQASSQSAEFKSTLGKTCQLNSGNYENPVSISKTNCNGFMFWNAVHPSTMMNAVIAKKFLKMLSV